MHQYTSLNSLVHALKALALPTVVAAFEKSGLYEAFDAIAAGKVGTVYSSMGLTLVSRTDLYVEYADTEHVAYVLEGTEGELYEITLFRELYEEAFTVTSVTKMKAQTRVIVSYVKA